MSHLHRPLVTNSPVPYSTQRKSALPMSTDWTTPYHAAHREQDPAKLHELCEKARHAINDRMLALGTQGADTIEREDLEEALRRLVAHESKTLPPPFEGAGARIEGIPE